MSDQRCSDNERSNRDVPSFIEPMPPLISNPFMRPRPQKGTNLLELFEEDSEIEEPELLQVYLRLKPGAPNNLYEVKSDRCLITSVDTATAGHGRRTQHNVSKMYTFSHIFGAQSTQKEIFEHVVKDNLKKLPDGNSFTLLTYGASGSGKTYTLMGTVASPGLVPRSLEYVFRVVDAAQTPLFKPSDGGADKLNLAEQDYEIQWVKRLRHVSAPLRDKYRRMSAGLCKDLTTSSIDLSTRPKHYVWVSFIEIYNEGIYDLLATSNRSTSSKLRIREDATGQVYVKGATQAFVRSGEEAYDVMVAGKHNLQVAATGVHAHSSRSHCIFTITVMTETGSGVRASCVRLCDLAGCERARRTRNTGARMAESRAINSSLHVLERCLHTLRRGASCVPYRESKLTRVLGAGLSGTRGESVSMVVTLNPAPEYAHETRHVLQLAAVARNIQVNNTIAESTLEISSRNTTVNCSMDTMRLRAENERLHFELHQSQARNKELLAMMEEKQQEAATTMQELVEEAKDMTRQYYETQIQALRSEMEDMAEEYEARLSKDAASIDKNNTPSRSLQNKVTQLMTEIAILEEQLAAERLARVCAEEEVQHLRACIEERDEKENASSNPEDVMTLSDSESDHSDEENDICNESLEPTFKKENINRSRLLIKNNLDQTTTGNDNDSIDSARDSDSTLGQDDDASVDKSNDSHTNSESYFDKDDTNVCTKTHKDQDNVNVDDVVVDEMNLKSKILMNDCKLKSENKPTTSDNDDIDKAKLKNNIRGTYFIETNDFDLDDTNNISGKNEKTSKTLSRGTYFVSDKKIHLNPEDVKKMSPKTNETVNKILNKSKDSMISKLIESNEVSQISDNSLYQFEQLEMAAREDDVSMKHSTDFVNMKVLQEKKTYFEDKIEYIPRTTGPKEKRTYFSNIVANIQTEDSCKKHLKDTRSPSIVKDDIESDIKPSTMKILLGDNVSRQTEILPIKPFEITLNKKHDSIDVFEGFDSPSIAVKTEYHNIVENARKSLERVVLGNKNKKSLNTKFDNTRELKSTTSTIKEQSAKGKPSKFDDFALPAHTISKYKEASKELSKHIDIVKKDIKHNESSTEHKNDSTIVEFENIYKNITIPRATEFELLLTQDESTNNIKENKADRNENRTEEVKYNLRHKAKETVRFVENKEESEEVLLESNAKCESKSRTNTKRSLRLRRKKNQSESDDKIEQENDKLKDLQKEFSDVTMDVPATAKQVDDIPSPEKPSEEQENVPPAMGVQSCPSKSVTRSRRKLFTPRTEPLDEDDGPCESSEGRLHVPRPSYHKPRARRKL